jgi:hypothetical protein
MGLINLTNGNLHLDVPLGSFPQRGSQGFSATLSYDSRIWQEIAMNPAYLTTYRPFNMPGNGTSQALGGWRLVISSLGGAANYMADTELCDSDFYPWGATWARYSGFSWTEPNGASHAFDQNMQTYDFWPKGQANCGFGDSPGTSGYATDGSGLFMVVSNHTDVTVYDKNGNQVAGALGPIDTNGNYFSSDANGNAIDTLGRVPVITSTSGNNIYYDVLNALGSRSRYTVTTTTISVSVPNYTSTMTVIQSITLPNNTKYTFGYDAGTSGDNWGLVNSVTLPTGGQVTYGYQTFTDAIFNLNNTNRWVNSRTSGGGTWHYTPLVTNGNFPGDQQVTVTKPSSDYVIYKFHGRCGGNGFAGFLNTETDSYVSGGTLLKQELIDYQDDACAPLGNAVLPSGVGGESAARIQRLTTVILSPGGTDIQVRV